MKVLFFSRWSSGLFSFLIFVCFLYFSLVPEVLFAATQKVYFSPVILSVNQGAKAALDLYYDVSEGIHQTTGLGISIHYNSKIIESFEFDNIYQNGLIGRDYTPQMDVDNSDGDPSTDKYYVIAWVDLYGKWPADNSLPLILSHISFMTAAGLTNLETKINVSSTSSPEGYKFNGDSFLLTILP